MDNVDNLNVTILSDKNTLITPVKQHSPNPKEPAHCTICAGDSTGITNTFGIDIADWDKITEIAMSITMPNIIEPRTQNVSTKDTEKNMEIYKEPYMTSTYIEKSNQRKQAITDVIASVALEQSALANILQAEGEKIQKVISMKLTTEQTLAFQRSACSVVEAIFSLECILKQRLSMIDCNPCDKP